MGKASAGFKLVHGDCFAEAEKFAPVQLVVTDPPYNLTQGGRNGSKINREKHINLNTVAHSFQTDFDPLLLLTLLLKICNPFNVYIWTDRHILNQYIQFAEAHGFSWCIFVWAKPNPIPVYRGTFCLDKEFCFHARASKAFADWSLELDAYRTVLTVPIGGNASKRHPTQKPAIILRRFIRVSSRLDDVILDPFMGGGSTAVACALEGRSNFVGIEKNLEYFAVAQRYLRMI